MKGAVPSFQAHSCSSDGKLSNGAKIYLVFTIRILRNSCKWCAIIIVLFTVGRVVAMEMECLWLLFGVCNITAVCVDLAKWEPKSCAHEYNYVVNFTG